MPDDCQVCNCNGVSKGAIRQYIANGKRSPAAVMAATRAGMGCGSCKSRVQELVTFYCEGDLAEDSVLHYSVPAVSMAKPELA